MRPILFSIGSFQIPAYGAALMVAFLFAIFWTAWKAPTRGTTADHLYNLGFIAVGGGIIGGRLEYVRTHWHDKFSHDLGRIFEIWDGGLVFYGGFVLGLAGSVLWSHWRKQSVLGVFELTGISIPIAIGITRLGCFGAGCCYGEIAAVSWAVSYPPESELAPGDIPLHPTPLYETAYTWTIALVVWLYSKSPLWKREGEGLFLFVVLYAIARSINETFRADAERGYMIEGVLTNGQGTSLILVVLAVVAWQWVRRLPPRVCEPTGG